MGHKVHPVGFRIGVIRDWQAKWYADKHYAEFLQEDLKLRKAIQSRYGDTAVSLVEIERQANQVAITIHTARPGIVIGRGGQRVDETRGLLEKMIGKKVQLNIREIPQPELDAFLVARTVADQIERRIAYRRAMKQAMLRTMQAGAKGMKVSCAGRLGGAEIARRLNMHEGQVPLHTLRADVDYGFTEARTTMGRIGVKVWIYKGQILPEPKTVEEAEVTAVEPVAEAGAEVAPAVEPVVEPVVEVSAEVAPVAEEAPAKPAAKRRAKAVPSPEPAEAVVAPVAEEAPAKPAAKRRAKAVPSSEPAEAVVAPVAEEVPAKPATKRRRVKAAPAAEPGAEAESSAESGESDAAA